MCIFRAIYFYLQASGVFDDSTALSATYLLIELPTLLYFTALSSLAAFWLFLLFARRRKRIHYIIAGVISSFDLALYLVFTLFIVLYQELQSTTPSLCPDRIPDQEDNTNQQIVMLVYQSIMAGVSILLGMTVVLFGVKVYFSLTKKAYERKIALIAMVCAAGLLLHCGFILYLTATLEYDFTIIVLMVVLSELLPITLVTLQFALMKIIKQKTVQTVQTTSISRISGLSLDRTVQNSIPTCSSSSETSF